MNWFLRYLTSNDPKRTITKTGVQFRKAIYPLVRRLSGPLTDVEGILVKNAPVPKGPKIFAVTHTYSREDIAWAISLAGEQSYLRRDITRPMEKAGFIALMSEVCKRRLPQKTKGS